MKAYFAIKYREDTKNDELIGRATAALEKAGIETYVFVREFQNENKGKKIGPEVLMTYALKAIDESDFVIAEFSEKGVGIGIEAGYAFARKKPVVVIAKEGSDISSTLRGISKVVILYKDLVDMEAQLLKLEVEYRGVCFLLMRSDKKILMQLRDDRSAFFKNMWCFPGGACDPGEDYIDTAIREAYEEYEITVEKEDCFLLMKRILDKMHIFICQVHDDQKPVLKEGADMQWMSIEEIKKLVLGFDQDDIVLKLEAYLAAHNTP